MELAFAVLISLGAFYILRTILQPRAAFLKGNSLFGWIIGVFCFKFWIAFTMGHLDVTRFIIFLQEFIKFPFNNPWDYNPGFPHADFPYPPFLLYLHAIPFFLFKGLITHSPSLNPTGFTYTLFRLPLVLFDLWWFKELVLLVSKENSHTFRKVLFSYLFCTVILFHQYYSGQLDLIAAIPFFLSCLEIEQKTRITPKAFTLLTLSLCLKPFAIIFLPFIFLRIASFTTGPLPNRTKVILTEGIILATSIFLFKLSELPFLLTESYQSKMGVGASVLYQKYAILGAKVFPVAYLIYSVFIFRTSISPKKQYNLFFSVLMITLLMGATTQHSAGWMLWGCAAYCLLIRNFNARWTPRVWWTWNIFFVVRWSFVSHSPVADSFGVFLTKFLHFKTAPEMGYLFHRLESNYGLRVANQVSHLSEVFFILLSALFGMVLFMEFKPEIIFKNDKTSIS